MSAAVRESPGELVRTLSSRWGPGPESNSVHLGGDREFALLISSQVRHRLLGCNRTFKPLCSRTTSEGKETEGSYLPITICLLLPESKPRLGREQKGVSTSFASAMRCVSELAPKHKIWK